jgi:Reverse transcriptase (RNA-dependent DNA polymerase)
MQAVEIISPKSRYGFRIVHQLPLLETLLFTAAIIEIGSSLEKIKRPKEEFGPFPYRFDPKVGASLFEEKRSYRDWLQWQFDLPTDEKFDVVIYTDIADYYQRTYLPRIENILDTATNKKGINKFITRLIKQIRSKQTHGIPIGGSAARVLAEAVLSDTDSALADEGFQFTRYMDDYRIFVREGQSAYHILAFLAEQLATGEGLSLNAHKTRVISATAARSVLAKQLIDVYDEAQQGAIEPLTHALYFDEMPDPADVDKLRSMNLLAALEREIEEEFWEFTKIRTLFLGLRLTEDDDAVQYLTNQLATFIPFVKDVVLFFDIMHEKGNWHLENSEGDGFGATCISAMHTLLWLT